MADRPAGTFSGGPIEDFKQGWARLPFAGTRAHWWVDVTVLVREQPNELPEDGRVFYSLCKMLNGGNSRVRPLAPGNIPLCRNCMKRAERWTTKEERLTFFETNPEVAAMLMAARVHD